MPARWPCLILPRYCKTDIHVLVELEDHDHNGAPIIGCDWTGKCNYQDKARRIFTDQQKVIQVTGTCLIPGDIAPELATIPSGLVTVFEVEREIAQGSKVRNPDGTVNYTQLELV